MHSFTILLSFGVIACASAGAISYSKHYNDGGSEGESELGEYSDEHKDYYHHPQYKFEYGVKDEHTGDHKSHWEHRDGDKVEGEYTLDEADGTKRIVSYHADGKTGFHAEVKRVGHATHHVGYSSGGYEQEGY